MIDLEAAARELSRMRMLAQKTEYKRDFAQSFAECLVLDKYGRLPSVADLKRDTKRKVNLVPKDENGALVRTIASDWFPMRVYRTQLGADKMVFVRTERHMPSSQIVGWLPRELVLSMPTEKIPDRADDFYYVVERGFLIPMPDRFRFEEPEHHQKNDWNAIWSDLDLAWECCTCGRLIPDTRMYEAVMRERAGLNLG